MITRACWYQLRGPQRGNPRHTNLPRWAKCMKDFRCMCRPRIAGQPVVQCQNIVKKGDMYFNTEHAVSEITNAAGQKFPIPMRICFFCANEVLKT